jgi:hypothetical protein
VDTVWFTPTKLILLALDMVVESYRKIACVCDSASRAFCCLLLLPSVQRRDDGPTASHEGGGREHNAEARLINRHTKRESCFNRGGGDV